MFISYLFPSLSFPLSLCPHPVQFSPSLSLTTISGALSPRGAFRTFRQNIFPMEPGASDYRYSDAYYIITCRNTRTIYDFCYDGWWPGSTFFSFLSTGHIFLLSHPPSTSQPWSCLSLSFYCYLFTCLDLTSILSITCIFCINKMIIFKILPNMHFETKNSKMCPSSIVFSLTILVKFYIYYNTTV